MHGRRAARRREKTDEGKVDEFFEDLVGIGRRGLNAIVDLIVRPRTLLLAHLEHGADGGGRYTTPFRLYLALTGISMLLFTIYGGYEQVMRTAIPPEGLAEMAELAGKSVDSFLADMDQWMSIVSVPVFTGVLIGAMAPLLRWWSGQPGLLPTFRQALSLTNGWYAPLVPLTPIVYDPVYAQSPWIMLLMVGVLAVWFVRMGRGIWFHSIAGGIVKAVVISLAGTVSILLGSIPIVLIGQFGAIVF